MATKDNHGNNDVAVQRLLKQFYIQKETTPTLDMLE